MQHTNRRPNDSPARLTELRFRREQITKAIQALERLQRLRQARACRGVVLFRHQERLAG